MESKAPFFRRRGVRLSAGVVLGLLLLIGCLPTLVAKTSLRNSVVNHVLDDPRLQATAGDASFGWTSSTSLDRLNIVRDDERLRIGIQRVSLQRSLLGLIFASPDIGSIEIDRPQLELHLPKTDIESALKELKPASKRKHGQTTFLATIRNAGIVIHTADAEEPVVDLTGVTTTLQLRQATSGRVFVIDPMTVLDHQQLTPEICGRGLQLVAPVLADATAVSGEMSVEIVEFHVPVDRSAASENAEPLRISGVVALHQVQSSFTNPIAVEVTKMVSGLLNQQPPETIRVLDDTRVHFEIRDDCVYHEGLAFVLPEVSEKLVIRTSGTVGYDERLDLNVEIGLPSDLTVGVPVLEKLTQHPLKLVLRGTLDQPQVELAEGQEYLGEFSARLGVQNASDPPKDLAPAIIDLVSGLTEEKPVQKKSDKVEQTTKDVLDLIRSIQKESKRKKQRERKQ